MEIEAFLAYWQNIKKCSPRTIRSYRNDLALFQSFMNENNIRRITQVDHKVIADYIEYLRQKPNPRFNRVGLRDASIDRRLACLSSYFEYVRGTGSPKLKNPLKDLTHKWSKNDAPKPVDEVILDQLVYGITNMRDRLLVLLFLATGLRVFEMHQLNLDTITLYVEVDSLGEQRLGGKGEVLGKGKKIRKFFVDDVTAEAFAEYKESRRDENPALFLSERKSRMSVRAMQYTVSSWCKKLGLGHVRIHQFRHSFATRLANAHINSMVLRDLMSHTSLTTTQRYFKLHESTLAQAYFSAMEFVNSTSPVTGGAHQ